MWTNAARRDVRSISLPCRIMSHVSWSDTQRICARLRWEMTESDEERLP